MEGQIQEQKEEGKKLVQNMGNILKRDTMVKTAQLKGKMRDCYRIDKLLGKGAYGEVRQCVYKKNMKDQRTSIKSYRAVKIMSKAYMEKKDIDNFQNEVEVMHALIHPNIMKMHGYYEDPKRYLLIQDLCHGGELLDYLIKEGGTKQKIEPRDAAIVIKQILSSVDYMHKKNIVHRDLKPENILLERQKDLNDLKLIDFGTAKLFKRDSENGVQLFEKVGTSYYMAPEVIKVQNATEPDYEKTQYNELCDMWSIGVIAYMLCTGTQPFKLENNEVQKDIYKKIVKFKTQGHEIFSRLEFTILDSDTQSFIKRCITPRFKEECPYLGKNDKSMEECKKLITWNSSDSTNEDPIRMSAEEGLQHTWITNVAQKLINELSGPDDESLPEEKRTKNKENKVNAIKNLQALKNFRPSGGNDDGNRMKEAVLSIIGCKLLSDDQFKMIKDLFKIMDKSGDGTLENTEVREVFNKLMISDVDHPMDWTEKEIDEIISNVDCDKNGKIDFQDFLIASIRTNASFIGYMNRAYDMFFNNDEESIETNELIDSLCSEKIMKEELLRQVAENIDKDKSQSITACEFFDFVIKNLGLDVNEQSKTIPKEKWTPMLIKKLLEDQYPNIGQSGTFISDNDQ